ncbi:hypothetical protein T11_17110 [Trichinella zimbabwensis]|uniref:Uncharacterized protein n=1 Tax=Trichinella zimbabwensis TaxID=268475 RepID=A0A0V1HKT4_9BILA|nr:hypothetical protein T11_17110 [Trichinella zimbabwensis]
MSKMERIHVFTTLWAVVNVKSFQMLRDEPEFRQCYRPECMLRALPSRWKLMAKFFLYSNTFETWANNCALWKNRHQTHLNSTTLVVVHRVLQETIEIVLRSRCGVPAISIANSESLSTRF